MRTIFRVSLYVAMSLLVACVAEEGHLKAAAETSNINVQLGMTYMQQGNNKTAMKRLQKSIRQNPDNALAYSTLGLLNARLGETEEAESNFKKAVKLDPVNSGIRNNFGAFLCKQKRYKESQVQFLQAIKNPLYGTPEHAYLNAGSCTDNKAEAEKYFRASLRRNPRFPAGLLKMASLSLDLKRYLSARGYIQRFHAVHKPVAASLWVSIQVEKVLGDTNLRASQVMLLKEKFPDSEENRLYLQSKEK